MRILVYHGICRDEQIDHPWMPRYFVTQSEFEQQLACLREHANVISLAEGIQRLKAGSLPPRAVAITFDDGYANNLHLGVPLLQRYAFPATIFLATEHITTGELYLFDRLRLIELRTANKKFNVQMYKSSPLQRVRDEIAAEWEKVASSITREQLEALRPLRLDELDGFPPELVSFGAHTHHHCILRNESRANRDEEIEVSVAWVNKSCRSAVPVFAYPNGRPGDFDRGDQAVLSRLGIIGAVTTVAGLNPQGTPELELRRLTIPSGFDLSGFLVHISGLRNYMLDRYKGLAAFRLQEQ